MFDLVEYVRIGEAVVLTRAWDDSVCTLQSRGFLELPARTLVYTHFETTERRELYQQSRATIGDCWWSYEDGTKVHFDAKTWLGDQRPRQHLPGLTFTVALHLSGIYLDPVKKACYRYAIVDGSIKHSESLVSDLALRTSFANASAWLSSKEHFRSLFSQIGTSGNILLVGALTGLFCSAPGIRLPSAFMRATASTLSLVEDHRYLRDAQRDLWSLRI